MEFPRSRYLAKLVDAEWNGKVKIVTGIRRCGKSYLLFKLFRDRLLEDGVPEDHIITVDLEDYSNRMLRSPDELYGYVRSKISDGRYYLLIDEIQHVIGFADVLNGFRHIDNLDTYVTGSNSRMLSSDIPTEFRGRGYEVRMHPLSFTELMEASPDVSPESLVQRYMVYGGMPEAVLIEDEPERSSYLKGLVKGIYLMDIEEHNSIRSDGALANVLDVVSSSIGSPTNPKRISDTLDTSGFHINVETVSRYLTFLEDSFLFERARRYDIKGRRYITTPSKYYCEDPGLRNAALDFRQSEYTHLMENIIYNELRRRGYDVDVGMVSDRVFKDGVQKSSQLEVDFVVNRGYRRYYIQSVYSIADDAKKEMETRPFKKIGDSFRKVVIVHEGIVSRMDDDGVLYIGLVDFLRDEHSLDLRFRRHDD